MHNNETKTPYTNYTCTRKHFHSISIVQLRLPLFWFAMAERHSSDGEPSARRRRIEDDDEDKCSPTIVVGGRLNGSHACFFCFCVPCVVDVQVLPDFVRGSAAPHLANVGKRYKLYRKFWSFLRKFLDSERIVHHWPLFEKTPICISSCLVVFVHMYYFYKVQ